MTVMTGGVWLAVVAIAGAILVAWKPVKTFFVGFVEGMRRYMPDIREGLGDILQTLRDLPMIGRIIGKIADIFGNLQGEGEGFTDWFGPFLIRILGDVNAWLEDLVSRINASSWGEALGQKFARGFISALPGFGRWWGREMQELFAADTARADAITRQRKAMRGYTDMAEELAGLAADDPARQQIMQAMRAAADQYVQADADIRDDTAERVRSEAARQTQDILQSMGAGGYMTGAQWRALQASVAPQATAAPVSSRVENRLENVTINVEGAADPDATGRAVRQELESTFADMAENVQSPVDR